MKISQWPQDNKPSLYRRELGSYVGTELCQALLIAALIVRTALEDRTLRDELAGYAEYTQKVRYRIVPGIW